MSLPIEEEWRPVLGFEAEYEVSNQGRVRRCRDGSIRKPQLLPNGYWQLRFYRGGRAHHRYIHRLVTEAFRGPAPEGHIVRHLDGVKTNNVAENLCWGTPRENNLDSVRHGVNPSARKTHCPRGHAYDDANTEYRQIQRRGRQTTMRVCRTCQVDWRAEARKRLGVAHCPGSGRRTEHGRLHERVRCSVCDRATHVRVDGTVGMHKPTRRHAHREGVHA